MPPNSLSRPLRPIASSLGCSACQPTASAASRPTASSSPSTLFHLQRRHAATSRRTTHLLNVQPAPTWTPGTAATSQSHIVFNPPSSSPNVYHTPPKFMPTSDPRRKLYELTQAPQVTSSTEQTNTSLSGASPLASKASDPCRTDLQTAPKNSTLAHLAQTHLRQSQTPLPPPVRQPYEKKYHLTESDVAEIRRLREENPRHWTRVRLAGKFNCSQFFVGLVAKTPEIGKERELALEEQKRKWGRWKREAREDRQRRKEIWGRDG